MQNEPAGTPTVYALRFTEGFDRARNTALVYVRDTAGDARAFEWQEALYTALATLATFPARKPAAPEAGYFAPPPVRALLFQASPGAAVWRVLFRVFEAGEQEGPRVSVITLHHSAARPLTRKAAKGIDADNG